MIGIQYAQLPTPKNQADQKPVSLTYVSLTYLVLGFTFMKIPFGMNLFYL